MAFFFWRCDLANCIPGTKFPVYNCQMWLDIFNSCFRSQGKDGFMVIVSVLLVGAVWCSKWSYVGNHGHHERGNHAHKLYFCPQSRCTTPFAWVQDNTTQSVDHGLLPLLGGSVWNW